VRRNKNQKVVVFFSWLSKLQWPTLIQRLQVFQALPDISKGTLIRLDLFLYANFPHTTAGCNGPGKGQFQSYASQSCFSCAFPSFSVHICCSVRSMVDTRIVPLKIALEPGCDTANVIYRTIAETDNITIECFTKRKACRDHQYKDTLASPIAVERNHCEGFQMGITKNYSDHEPVRQPMSHT